MATHVPIILRKRGRYRLCPQDGARGVHRTFGSVIADVDVQTAAELIAAGHADLHVGPIPAGAEHLDVRHPNSAYQRSLRRRAERDALIRNYLISHPPQ